MAIHGQNNNMYSNQLSKQYQMGLGTFKNSRTGLVNSNDRASFQAMGRAASSVFREARAQENSATNLQSLAQTAAVYQQMGMNVDVNQLAAMFDADGNNLLNGKELQKAENALNMMYMQQTQQMSYANMQNGMTGMSQTGAQGGGGFDVGSAVKTLTNGLGTLFGGGGSSEAGASQGSGDGGGNFLSKAGDFIGKLFG